MKTTAGKRRPTGLYLESSPDERYGVLPGEDRPVRDLMSREVTTIHPSASVREAATLMRDRGTPYLIVMEGSRLQGVIDEHDVVVHGATGSGSLDVLPVKALLPAEHQPACREDALLADAARLMAAHRRHTLPVLDKQDRVVGVLSLLDVAGAVMPSVAATWLSQVRSQTTRN